MRIPLDRQSTTPLYRQVEDYLRRGIRSGSLPSETRLPASRTLARDLGLNRLTVETAYAGLEAEGLVYSRQGSGTYVAALPPGLPQTAPAADLPWPRWHQPARPGAHRSNDPAPSDLLLAAGHPDPIDLSGGAGDIRHFPADEFRKVMQGVMRRDDLAALDYGDRRGYTPLRSAIAQVTASQGLALNPEGILVTSGSQQALSLVCQVLLSPGDTVLVEAPTYASALDLFELCGVNTVGIPTDEHGMQVETLEAKIRLHHPRLIYTIPNFSNPTGACLSGARRRQLIALAGQFDIPILEDDFVGDLRYEGRAQPALKALDPGGRVIYVSTFSKMLMPGLRVGFLTADGPVYERLAEAKRVTDLTTSGLVQRALEAYVTIGRYQAFLRRSCQRYRRRRDALVSAIHQHLPSEVCFGPPQGGLFVWLRLPEGVRGDDLLPEACQRGVAFAPGSRFFVDPADGESFIRLNFACQPPEHLQEGVRRLGEVMRNSIR
jgi:GntR family transcriptional regulator/MocR family aminotransferase